MNKPWTTRVAPELTERYGVTEVHAAVFEPDVWNERRNVISLLIPECELQIVFLAADGEPIACVNRPERNKNVKHWLRLACGLATEHHAFLKLGCNTNAQAEANAKRAAKLLRNHRRIALERMYEVQSRVTAGLN